MIAYVLTRTAGRPKMFARLRESLLSQDFPGRVFHLVHAETGSTYAKADAVIHGNHLPRSLGTAPWELHNRTLLEHLATLVRGTQDHEPTHPEGWITMIDDDDEYTSRDSLSRMLQHATDPSVMPVWRVERENGRLSPATWQGDLASFDGSLCWEAAAHHTRWIGRAKIDADGGADGRYWQQLSQHLTLVWQDETLTRAQVGKGKGKRRDY